MDAAVEAEAIVIAIGAGAAAGARVAVREAATEGTEAVAADAGEGKNSSQLSVLSHAKGRRDAALFYLMETVTG